MTDQEKQSLDGLAQREMKLVLARMAAERLRERIVAALAEGAGLVSSLDFEKILCDVLALLACSGDVLDALGGNTTHEVPVAARTSRKQRQRASRQPQVTGESKKLLATA